MKHGPSLQEERDALLEHIHASRAAYRRMLTEVNTAEEQKLDNRIAKLAPEQPGFPRSMTVRWIMKHPYLSALAVAGTAALVVIGPRRAMQTIGNRTAALKHSAAIRGSGPVLGALTAVASTMLRNPSRVQLAVRAFSSAAQFLRRRRQRHP
jgi:hypothetical protein